MSSVQTDQVRIQGAVMRVTTATPSPCMKCGLRPERRYGSMCRRRGRCLASRGTVQRFRIFGRCSGPTLRPYVEAAQAAQKKRVGHGPVRIEEPTFVVEQSGHPRAFAGRAYVPQLVPAGIGHGSHSIDGPSWCSNSSPWPCFGTMVVNPECGTTPPSTNVIAAPAQNVQPITVNAGPANNYANGLFTSVTICVPGSTSNCQTIDGVLVDTGSSGLRVLVVGADPDAAATNREWQSGRRMQSVRGRLYLGTGAGGGYRDGR